jgi:Pentapeptide repeats (8 copies)
MMEIVIPVLLVGYLMAAVVVAGEQECDGPYKGRKPPLGAVERGTNLCQAILEGAELFDTNLSGANLQGARLTQAELSGANLEEANLQGAILFKANLQGARLDQANLQGTSLAYAELQRAVLAGTDLQGTILAGANLQGARYEPKLEKLPNFLEMTVPGNHLDKLVFRDSPAGLITLREAFKKAGMRTQERQLTYAIEHTKQVLAWDPTWYDPTWGYSPTRWDTRSWLEKLAGKSESLFKYVLFDLPSQYGMAPGLALRSLLGFIPCFALLYWIVLRHASNRSSLWIIVPADRLTRGRGHEKVVRIQPRTAKTWRGRLRNTYRLSRTCLYFSLLSAFSLGWREFNVGTWITRMQPREYTLRATGWGRTVAGIQSLLSVYLLALWVLTYFGRPFE